MADRSETTVTTDQVPAPGPGPVPAQAEVVEGEPDEAEVSKGAGETIESPAKVLRIGTMTRELLGEVRRPTLDEAGRRRRQELCETSEGERAW